MAQLCFKRASTLKLALYTVCRHENSPILAFSVFAYLKAISPAAISKTLFEENFEEMKEIH